MRCQVLQGLFTQNSGRPGIWGRMLAVLVLSFVVSPPSLAQEPGIRVPEGFQVELFADDDLAHDVHSLTIDGAGRIVVSGPGYIRILIDEDQDGRADSFRQFADGPATGSQGMYFLGSTLLCAGDDGLLIYRDDNRDDKADGPPQVFLKIAAGGEHHVHSIQKGPDGYWYVIAGNFSGVTQAYATRPTSPIHNPVSGTLLRLRPDLSGGEIVADGFRNAYDFAFNAMGDFFTFDSDDERDISLPWYLPTQVFHVLPLSNAGYVSAGLKRPGSAPDMPPVLATFGRGSPTGVICYQHDQFPANYRGALFVQDWTLGRILVVTLSPDGAGWKGTPLEFAQGQNQFGFAPTDMEVGPDGSVYVSVGGRGTRGSVFRVRYGSDSATSASVTRSTSPGDVISAILSAPQPNTSWSRSQWVPKARSLKVDAFRAAALQESRSTLERLRAIEVMVEIHGGLDTTTSTALAKSDSSEIRAKTAWALGRSRPEAPESTVLKQLLLDRNPQVRRCALEALTSVSQPAAFNSFLNEVAQCLASDDRLIRLSAAQLLIRMNDEQRSSLETALSKHPRGLLWYWLGRLQRTTSVSAAGAQAAVDVITNANHPLELRRDAVRVLQMALSDVGPGPDHPPVFDGYVPRAGSLESIERELNPLLARVGEMFPTGDAAMDHELVRVIAMTSPLNRDLFSKLLAGITDKSEPAEDIHRLVAVSRMSLERSYEESIATAKALIGIDIKVRKLGLKQDTNWDDRITELYAELCTVDPAMPTVITSQPGFGQPGHVLFLSKVPQGTVAKAIEGLVKTISTDPDYTWTNEVVFAIGESAFPEHRLLLREQLENYSVRDAVLIVLAETADREDRDLYLSGLESTQLNAVEACLQALTKLPRSNDAAEQYQLLSAARRLINDEREFQLREIAVRLLQNNTEQSRQFVFGSDGYKPQPESMRAWQLYLEERYPDYRPESSSEAAQKILGSLDTISWTTGDAERGRKLFERLSCAKCHGGRRALGPDLTGVSRRFSRDDLFAAIVDPNRDISPRYQTTSVLTRSGKVFTGLIVYESVDGLLLRDSDHKTYRIEAHEVESRILQRNSLMPNGLLKDAAPQDLADLYRYLQSL
jgi:putative membrane-bound dehydrogenase-like protein